MEEKTYEQIKQVVNDYYMGRITMEAAKADILNILATQCSPYDTVLPGITDATIGLTDDLLAAIIPTALSSYTPPDNVLETLQELAEMFIICGDDDIQGDIILYRGCNDICNNGLDIGYCYTTDYEVARLYAQGLVCFHESSSWTPNGTIYTVRVPLRYIIGRTKSYNGSEVVVLPPAAGGQISVIKEERVTM